MLENKHTPAPWSIGDYQGPGESSDLVYGAPLPHGHFSICSLTGYFPREQRMANAKLIAAAPDLLADLREAATTLRRYEALHRDKGTDESTAKAEVNAALASRFETTIAKATQ